VVLTVAACLMAILAYVAMEYGYASIPEFLFVSLGVLLISFLFW
jgi:hypothetical protein